jgi:hypothetical protein
MLSTTARGPLGDLAEILIFYFVLTSAGSERMTYRCAGSGRLSRIKTAL